ncbi:MAG: hypothetical protein KDD82_08910 [Planctomycetes bacterium]|nr:hypothetical protein [Planctomycetota bacterium]
MGRFVWFALFCYFHDLGWVVFVECATILLPGSVSSCAWTVSLSLGEEFVRPFLGWERVAVLSALAAPTLLLANVLPPWANYLLATGCSPAEALEHVLLVIRADGFWETFSPRSCLPYLAVFLPRTLSASRGIQLGVVAMSLSLIAIARGFFWPYGLFCYLALSLGLMLGEGLEACLVRRWRGYRRRRR